MGDGDRGDGAEYWRNRIKCERKHVAATKGWPARPGGATLAAMEVVAREAALIADLAILPSWQERLEELLRRDRRRRGLTPAERADAARVPGCLSRVWLVATEEAGRCRFRTDAEAPAVRALVGTLAALYDNVAAGEVAAHEPTFLAALELEKHLTGTRRDALTKARDAIRGFAAGRG